MSDQPTSLRLPTETLARSARVAERLAHDPMVAALLGGATPSRTAVIRLAIERGLEALEREHPVRTT
jgi:predicted DNA-binding protein